MNDLTSKFAVVCFMSADCMSSIQLVNTLPEKNHG